MSDLYATEAGIRVYGIRGKMRFVYNASCFTWTLGLWESCQWLEVRRWFRRVLRFPRPVTNSDFAKAVVLRDDAEKLLRISHTQKLQSILWAVCTNPTPTLLSLFAFKVYFRKFPFVSVQLWYAWTHLKAHSREWASTSCLWSEIVTRSAMWLPSIIGSCTLCTRHGQREYRRE